MTPFQHTSATYTATVYSSTWMLVAVIERSVYRAHTAFPSQTLCRGCKSKTAISQGQWLLHRHMQWIAKGSEFRGFRDAGTRTHTRTRQTWQMCLWQRLKPAEISWNLSSGHLLASMLANLTLQVYACTWKGQVDFCSTMRWLWQALFIP